MLFCVQVKIKSASQFPVNLGVYTFTRESDASEVRMEMHFAGKDGGAEKRAALECLCSPRSKMHSGLSGATA